MWCYRMWQCLFFAGSKTCFVIANSKFETTKEIQHIINSKTGAHIESFYTDKKYTFEYVFRNPIISVIW